MKKLFRLLLSAIFISGSAFPQHKQQLPVIDMHLHVLGADDHGHGPQYIGIPFRDFAVHDPKENYRDVFEKALKTNAWADKSVASPGTNDSMKLLTLKALKENNVYAVASGDYDKLRDWLR